MLSLSLLLRYLLNISFFTTGLYILAPIYHTLTRSISSDSISAPTVCLLLLHLFLHDYSGSTIRAPGALKNPNLTSCISLHASVVASVFVASRLPSGLHVFAVMLFSLQVFLFAPLVTYCIKKFSFGLHLVIDSFLFSFLFLWFLSMLCLLIGSLRCKSTSLRLMVLGMKPSFVLTLQMIDALWNLLMIIFVNDENLYTPTLKAISTKQCGFQVETW